MVASSPNHPGGLLLPPVPNGQSRQQPWPTPTAGTSPNLSVLSAGARRASAISAWEQQRQERGCQQTGDQGPQWEGPGGGMEDGSRPNPVSTLTYWLTVPFKVYKFMH